MLSRVANNLYWFGRYVQRAENTAALINVRANLLFDPPPSLASGLGPDPVQVFGAARWH